MDLQLGERTVLVTGGGRGFGRAISEAFAAEGATVALTYRPDLESAEDAAWAVAAAGAAGVHVIHMNLRSAASIEQAFAEAARDGLAFDVLVNNAVAWPVRAPAATPPFSDVPLSEWRDTIRANVEGTYRVTQLAAYHMRARGWGGIVNVSSIAATDGLPGAAAYAVAKSAADGLTRTLAAELSEFHILTNSVAPCLVRNGVAAGDDPSGSVDHRIDGAPRRPAATDVALVVLWLSSPLNRAINGQVVRLGVAGAGRSLAATIR